MESPVAARFTVGDVVALARRFGDWIDPPKAQQGAWICPRCGVVNAWWVAHCRCKPEKKQRV